MIFFELFRLLLFELYKFKSAKKMNIGFSMHYNSLFFFQWHVTFKTKTKIYTYQLPKSSICRLMTIMEEWQTWIILLMESGRELLVGEKFCNFITEKSKPLVGLQKKKELLKIYSVPTWFNISSTQLFFRAISYTPGYWFCLTPLWFYFLNVTNKNFAFCLISFTSSWW